MKACDFRSFLIAIGCVLLGIRPCLAQMAPRTQPIGRYAEIKTWHEQQMSLATTSTEKQEVLRQTVRRGSFSGDRRFSAMFNDFRGGFAFDPDIPGLSKHVLLTSSDNKNVVKGAARTLRYAGDINGNPRWEILKVGEVRRNREGMTDADLVIRNRRSGKLMRIEVKEMSPQSQRAGMKRIESQFRKMAEDFRRSGEIQVWINRRKAIPEVDALGKRHGVRVFGNVATGKQASAPGKINLDKVLKELDARHAFRPASVLAAAEMGFGIYQLWNTAPEAWNELEKLLDSARADRASWARFGQQGSLALGGGLLTASGGIKSLDTLGRLMKFEKLSSMASRLSRVSRWSSRLGVAATLAAGGFVVWEYSRGGLTDRQMAQILLPMGGAALGGIGGGWGGATLGAEIGLVFAGPVGAGIGTAFGGIMGGLLGGYAGDALVSFGVNSHYEILDRALEADRVKAIYAHYGLP